MLARYGSLEQIPDNPALWDVDGLRGASKLAGTLAEQRELALLFRRIATVVADLPVGTVDDWEWRGPTDNFQKVAAELGSPALATRAAALAQRRVR